MTAMVDMTGKTVGRLVVLSRGPSRPPSRQVFWKCRCDCGNETVVCGSDLRSGNTQSCGCLYRESRHTVGRTHGGSDRPEHGIWADIIQRCTNSKRQCFRNYGGRGIKVCARWTDSFEHFLADVGERPSPSHEIDRIDNEGDYEPGNVRWATPKEQARNKRNNRRLTVRGVTRLLCEWAESTGVHHTTILARLKQGWSVDDAVMTPVRKGNYRRRPLLERERGAA